MKKALLLTLLSALMFSFGFSQNADRFWSANKDIQSSIVKDKGVARVSFPKEFKLFDLNVESLRQELFSIVGNSQKQTTVISLPNAAGILEQFEVHETSNFAKELQDRFPSIRAFSGKGITDKGAILKLSISPQGIQTMIFRIEKPDEFIEAYSKDHTVYAVFESQRQKGQLQWTCSTPEENMAKSLNAKVETSGFTGSSTGELKTMRLAQSCNGEYSNFFGAFNNTQVALVLAAFNATLTRCNGCYEKDLAIHLNLVPESVNVIYYDPATDPYTTLANWNVQLQVALNTSLTGPSTPLNTNNAAYDIGHMFGASGGGGNAGCIGCVCVDGIAGGGGSTKGKGITSPADNIPMGDNFDIDYVVHEVGHQMGGNHTFSMSNEGTGVNKEVGSGITIMGYAGITNQDVAPHSIDIFHEATIAQIQANMAGKTCPVTTNITANNATPVVAPVANATIPMQTPFALTGSATDANPNDVLTYCWEQNDDGAGQTGNNSVAYPTKPTGPNWLSFSPTTSPTRLCPKLSTILAGLQITPVLPGGDAIANIEALSSVARTLNFRLTVRDNAAYVADPPASRKVAQTAFTDMTVTVVATAGPFQVTQPNTNLSWPGGTTQTITWDVNNTTAAPVSCANVKISLSTDGGNTFPTVLAASTPNDGTEALTIPATPSTTARIKVEAVGNIFFDISNTNFNITGAPTAPTVTINQAAAQPDPTSVTPINFTVVFSEPVTGFTTGDVTLSGTAGATTATVTPVTTSTYTVSVSGMSSSGTVIATIPANVCTSVASALANTASTSTDNTVTFNLVVANPNVTINQAAAQPDPTSVTPIVFTAVFDQPVTGFTTGDVTLSGTAGATTANVVPVTTTTYTINVSGMTGSGTVIATIAAGVCQNATAQPNNASTSTDNTVTFNAPPGCTSVNPVANQTVCNNSPTAAVTFSSPTAGTTFTWVNNTPSIGLAASGSGNIASFTATNATANAVTATITVTPTAPCGVGPTITFTITVNPTATVNAVPNQVVCAGAPTAAVNFTSPSAGAVFNWTNNTPAIGLAAAGTGNIPSFTALNPGNTPLVATVTVTPSVPVSPGPCAASAPQTFTNATPVAILDNSVVSSTMVVAGAPNYLYDLNLQTFITHTFAADLFITLTSPAGTVVTLTSGNGGGNDNVFNGTIWDDNANPGGQVPYTSNNGLATDQLYANLTTATPLAPEEPLGAFIGQNPNGTWTLRISDQAGGDVGTLASWSMTTRGLAAAPTSANTTATNSTPVAIVDNTVVSSTINVSGAGTQLLDLNMQTFITHTFASDLDITITSPAGTVVTLTTDNGGGNDNVYNGTIWDDSANPGGQVPYTSNNGMVTDHVYANLTTATPLTPEEPLAAFIGENPNGTWTIRISDDAGGDVGFLNSWSLNLQTSICSGFCAGTPRTFTITVNPNPAIIILADPGTTICEGDPTLLTVVTGTATPLGTLYTQTGASTNGSPSQVFEPANTAFNSQAADDFTVPAGATWNITQLGVVGTGAGTPTSVNVFFYANTGANLPGAAIATFNNVSTYTQAGGNYTVTLPSTVSLTGGTYWVSFQVNMSFATSGQWFWSNYGAPVAGNPYAWQNPGGGFATPCTTWGYGGSGCNVGGGAANVNNIFTLTGTSVVGGGPLGAGYTFLWSPAAGLSSITSNPVAASPQNTTTYTVVATTPGGCSRTASVLITVNKRPVVTTQPVNAVRCAGTNATFTVGATGTGLTYQWQQNTGGCVATGWIGLTNNTTYSGVTSPTLTITGVTGLMNGYGYRCIVNGVCAPWTPPTNVSNCATLTVNPLPVVSITPPISCGGVAGINGTQLSTASIPPPVPGSVTASSGTINLAVPDNTANGVNNVINLAGVPANATITNISVALNMPHTYPADMTFNLKAPNGQILNLYKHNTNTDNGPASVPTAGFYNAVVNATSSVVFSSVPNPYRYGQTAPAGPYKADALNGAITNPGYTIFDPTGFVSNAPNFAALYSTPNGAYTLAMADGGPGDLGTLTSWSVTVDYTVPGTTNSTLSYIWSPLAGLYNDPQATSAYTGTNTPVVYAAPTVFTMYTVTATNTITGCVSTASAFVNYTPPAPTIIPSSVAMCLGDPAVRLIRPSIPSTTVTAASGPISVVVPDGTGAAATSSLTIAGVPAASTLAEVKVTLNMNHTWVGDMDINLVAPGGGILNLVGGLNGGTGNNGTANFTNTAFSSLGGATISGAPAPRTNTYAAEARAGYGPTGFIQTVANWNGLAANSAATNGVWRLAMGDFGGGDVGTLTSWSIAVTYTTGVPSTPATWFPIVGLFTDPSALPAFAYTGTPRDTVWVRRTAAGVYPYTVTVQSLPVPPLAFTSTAPVTINAVGNASPYPSTAVVAGLPTTGVNVKSVTITGISHTWSEDVDILLQSPSGQNVILISDVGGLGNPFSNNTYILDDAATATLSATAASPSGTYKPTNAVGIIGVEPDNWPAPGPGAVAQPAPTLATFTGNMNGTWKLFVVDDAAGDAGSIASFSVNFNLGIPPCTSPATTVVVTVNTPTSVTTQPVNQTICTDKVATFTVVAGGSGPFSYQWQASTDGGNTYTNITNGGVYSGATTATLTITAPPVSMSNYFFRVVVTGAAPCASVTSFQARLIVNPLPVVAIAPVYSALFPGMTTTLTATVSPFAAASYTWIRDGVTLSGSSAGVLSGIGTNALKVDVDGMGTYTLRVTDVNGCTNTSNTAIVKDSASGRCFIYPNPTSGKFQVRYYSVAANTNLPRGIVVYDAKGDRVFSQNYAIGRPYDRMDVDMRAYGKGMFWVEIVDRNGNRLTICRVVIQ